MSSFDGYGVLVLYPAILMANLAIFAAAIYNKVEFVRNSVFITFDFNRKMYDYFRV